MDWFDDWALTLAVFVPVVGMAIVLLDPEGRGEPDQGGRAADHAWSRSGSASGSSPTSTTTGRRAAVPRQRAVDRRHPQPLPPRHRRHLAAAADPVDARSRCCCIIYSWNHFPEPHNPKAFLALILLLEVGHERHVRRPGPHPLLHLLRDRPAPDVLHDRRVGRPEPRVRVDQVLPVHAVRLGADAAELPGAVLPVEGADLRHRSR